ncbi:MAG: DNA polymerase III subunit delta' [Oscillospiraceae bacterium]|jgi:DNA polymerase-3 subunit delta'|nr:DNA polymerase III subunit delta' [Oscillospiraceae bacterium]
MLERWRWPSEQALLLLTSFQTGTYPHAYLLTGPDGTGKRVLAKIYAQALMCEALPERRPCGVCPSCLRVDHDSHPDITVIKPGEDPDSKSRVITVFQAREAAKTLSRKAFYGGSKVLIIHHADRTRHEAQNALLKTLEEPVGGCVFFLTADRRTSLLPTVRSRCVWVPVPPLDVAEASRVLVSHGMDARRADEAARYAHGAVGSALRYAEEVEPIARRTRGALAGIRSYGDLPASAKQLSGIYDEVKDPQERAIRAERILETMESLVRDALERLDAPQPAPDERLSLIDRIGRASTRTLLAMLDAVGDARRRLGMFISFTSIIDALVYAWLEETDNAAGGRDQVS